MISLVEKLPDEKAGQLMKIIFQYVNDKNPVVDDLILQIAFEPIKMQLKRDLLQWTDFITKQTLNGKKGGRPPEKDNPKNPSLILDNPKNPTNVTVKDKVNVNDKVTIIPEGAKPQKSEFKEPEILQVREEMEKKGLDSKEALEQAEIFMAHFQNRDWKLSGGKKMKSWELSVITWLGNYKQNLNKQYGKQTGNAAEEAKRLIAKNNG